VERDCCFCTLALGQKYIDLCRQLAGDLAIYAPKVPLVVLSDRPDAFSELENVLAIFHEQKSVWGYNDKLCVIDQALRLHRTCIFVDADGRIFDEVVLDDQIFEPGLRAYRVRNWAYNREAAEQNINSRVFRGGLRIMRLLNKKYHLGDDERIPFVVEFLFSITRSERGESFLQKWEEIANFCERQRFFIHEGYSIGLAAALTGFPIHQCDFRGLNFFELLIPLNEHGTRGNGITDEKYHSLRSSIQLIKDKGLVRRSLISRLRRKAKFTLNTVIRYASVRLFGLKLRGYGSIPLTD
jgi:hypothetical protein